MTTQTVLLQVVSSSDDGYWSTGALSDYSATDNTLKFGTDSGGAGSRYNSWLRFLSYAGIPQGATINSAVLTFTGMLGETTSVQLLIDGNAEDSAVAPTSQADAVAKSRTTAQVTWNTSAFWDLNTQHSSPDLSAIIQEIVSRPGYLRDNPFMLFIRDNLNTDTDVRRAPFAFDDTPAKSAFLTINYTPSGFVLEPPDMVVTDPLALENGWTINEYLGLQGEVFMRVVSDRLELLYGPDAQTNIQLLSDGSYYSIGTMAGEAYKILAATAVGAFNAFYLFSPLDDIQTIMMQAFTDGSTSILNVTGNTDVAVAGFVMHADGTIGSVQLSNEGDGLRFLAQYDDGASSNYMRLYSPLDNADTINAEIWTDGVAPYFRIGLDPVASQGVFRGSTTQGFYFRNVGDTDDIQIFATDASDNLFMGLNSANFLLSDVLFSATLNSGNSSMVLDDGLATLTVKSGITGTSGVGISLLLGLGTYEINALELFDLDNVLRFNYGFGRIGHSGADQADLTLWSETGGPLFDFNASDSGSLNFALTPSGGTEGTDSPLSILATLNGVDQVYIGASTDSTLQLTINKLPTTDPAASNRVWDFSGTIADLANALASGAHILMKDAA